MEFRAPDSGELAEIQQLNGLFLGLIQDACEDDREVLGFPRALVPELRALTADGLQRAAAVPRCLFTVSLSKGVARLPATPWDMALRAFTLAAFYGAWTAARTSSAYARTLYGLQPASVRQLRTLCVADLVSRSASVGTVCCGFRTVPSVWPALLDSSPEPLPRSLVLTLIAARRTASETPRAPSFAAAAAP